LGRSALPQIGARAEMPSRLGRAAESLVELRERDVRLLRRPGRETRFQVALRLPPELALHAQPAERQQELGLAGPLFQPLLSTLEALERVPVEAFAVEQRERAVPVALEGVLDDAVRLAAVAELHESPRRGRRHLRPDTVGARGAFPLSEQTVPVRAGQQG